MSFFTLLAVLLLTSGVAQAAAWTEQPGQWQLLSGTIYSNADRSYDAHGNAAWPELFQRVLLTNDIEYGWKDGLTLFGRTETAYVHLRDALTAPTNAVNNAFEAGARYRLGQGVLRDYDVLSLEVSGRHAGAFNFAYSANAHAGGQDGGFRFLYGTGYQWDGREGFFDIEAGYRFLSAPRPDQTIIDMTAGLWLSDRWMAMVQSFNLISSAAAPPYRFFRMHKLEFSAVWKIRPGLSLQAGAFFSPLGINALAEHGVQLSGWADL